MNRQPYCVPPRRWAPNLSPLWVRATRRYRRRLLERRQMLTEIQADGFREVKRLANRHGILITPNHSAHYDAPALYVAADRVRLPLHIMTAWQVFEMSRPFERWAMQRLGCFSVNRETHDRTAFKEAVRSLQRPKSPLVVFPEGDIYHTSDFVSRFQEGAAAIALTAAKRAEHPILAIPCGIKFAYLDDPAPSIAHSLSRLETHLNLPAGYGLPLMVRVRRVAEAALAWKEQDYLGEVRRGELSARAQDLANWILAQLELRLGTVPPEAAQTPDRVKRLRQCLIERRAEHDAYPDDQHLQDMEDLFLVTQLYSHRPDYLSGQPAIERIAETVDKFEEDILGHEYPSVRGRRRVSIEFGSPVRVDRSAGDRNSIPRLTSQLQHGVQGLLDRINHRSQTGIRSDRFMARPAHLDKLQDSRDHAGSRAE